MWLAGLVVLLVVFLVVLPARVRLVFWRGLAANAALAGVALIFSLLSLSLVWSTGQRVDAWAFMALNVRGPRPRWLDGLMLAFTQLGNGLTSFVIAVLYWTAGLRLFAYQLILGTLTLWLMVELVKALARRRRPYQRLAGARLVGRRPIGRSFPSGHTSQAFFLATVLAQHFHAGAALALLFYTLALLVGLTRIYVGAHYPRDVLAGAILGTAWGFLGTLVEGYSWLRVA